MWANIAKLKLPAIENLVCFGSTKLKELEKKTRNSFWKDVVREWANFSAAYEPDGDEILSDKIWFSDNTKYKKTFVRDWDRKGLRFIADLFCKETGLLYRREQINSMYNIQMTFICYSSLMRSIPADVKSAKQLIEAPVLPFKIALLSEKSNISKIVYKSLLTALYAKQRERPSKVEQKWVRDVGDMHIGTMRDIRLSTKNSYLQSFHFRTVHRIVATNTFLYRIGKADSPLCTFCENEDETLLHVLWGCDVVQRFIKDVEAHLTSRFSIALNANKETWFFPRLPSEDTLKILMITLAKRAILRSKYMSLPPSMSLFCHC